MYQHSYAHLLSPARIGGLVVKNRMLCTSCLPHFLQGPETFPSESIIAFIEDLAKAGAAIVTVPDRFDSTRMFPMEDIKRAPSWDVTDPSVGNYLSHMAEAVHFQGSYMTLQMSKFHSIPNDVGVYAHTEAGGPAMMQDPRTVGETLPPVTYREITPDQMALLKEEIVNRAKYAQGVGFDGVVLHCAYSYNILAKFLQASTNLRTDEYGGSVENRVRFILSISEGIKEVCGQNFYVELQMSGDAMPEDELVQFAKLCEGKVDLLHLRLMDMDGSHMTPYNYDGISVPRTAYYAELIKASGAKVAVAPCGGFHNPDMNEKLIAEGKVDMVGMARPFISDPQYGRKIEEERTADIVPCLHCNKCHDHIAGEWASACRVNPLMGISHRAERMMDQGSGKAKKVAVIGGGPAGMRAALLASEAGHHVTLYEKSDRLGGQLKHADYPAFKWALKNYRDYLIDHVKADEKITIYLEEAADPAQIAEDGFDAVIAAVGAQPNFPDIPGLADTKVWAPLSVYGHEQELGKHVVVVGGGETGTETGMYLAECGHEVKVLTRDACLALESWSVHAYSLMKRRWEANENFTGITNAKTTHIAQGAVTYTDADGEHVLTCDSIVVSGGVRALADEALHYAGCSRQFFLIGDCKEPGNLQSVNRSALGAVSRL